MKLLTKEQQKSLGNKKICYVFKEKNEDNLVKNKKCRKVRVHCHYTRDCRGTAHSIHNLKCSVTKKMPISITKL